MWIFLKRFITGYSFKNNSFYSLGIKHGRSVKEVCFRSLSENLCDLQGCTSMSTIVI
jgi:hypothetical protein